MRHIPSEYLDSKPFKVVAGCDVEGNVERLYYSKEQALAALGEYPVLKLFGEDGKCLKGVGIVSNFAERPDLYFEDDHDTWFHRPVFRLGVDVTAGRHKGLWKDRYGGMSLQEVNGPIRKVFQSNNPIKDWQLAMEFIDANVARLSIDHDQFHAFLHSVPGYRLATDDNGKQFLADRGGDEPLLDGIAYLSIEYGRREGSYKSVTVTPEKGKKIVFNSGDPVKDWEDATTFLRNQSGVIVITLSSVDEFNVMIPGYGWKTDTNGHEMIVKLPPDNC